MPPAVESQSPNQWTTWEVLDKDNDSRPCNSPLCMLSTERVQTAGEFCKNPKQVGHNRWMMETEGFQEGFRVLLQAGPHIRAPAPTELQLLSDVWQCFSGELTLPLWAIAFSPPCSLLQNFPAKNEAHGQIKICSVAQKGKHGAFQVVLQAAGMGLDFSRSTPCSPFIHSTNTFKKKKSLDPRLKVLGLWSQTVWAPIPALLLMAVGC